MSADDKTAPKPRLATTRELMAMYPSMFFSDEPPAQMTLVEASLRERFRDQIAASKQARGVKP